VAESFFSSLEKERIRKRIYKTQDLARPTSAITSDSFTIGPAGTAIWAMSAPRRLNAPQREARICLLNWGKSRSRIGETRSVEPLAHRQRVNVLGALRHDGQLIWTTQQRPTRREDVIAFFDQTGVP